MNLRDPSVLPAVAALGSTFIALGAAVVSVVAIRIARLQVAAAQRDLTLTAYQNAVQRILDLKQTFAANGEVIFKKQMKLAPEIRDYVPRYMHDDIPTFLAFAGGMWRMSYVYSVMNRGGQLGLTDSECEGLRAEMLLWLRNISGFRDVYCVHTSVFKAHNPDLIRFLETDVYPDVTVQPTERA